MVGTVSPQTIEDTWHQIKGELRYTPLFHADHMAEAHVPDCQLFLKLELMQLTGSFKIRGVTAKIQYADKSIWSRGLFAASGGNHGRAVAYAGWQRGLKTTVYLPVTTAEEKIKMISHWGARIIVEGADLDEANELAAHHAAQENALFIHPFADEDVIKGQGTLGVELFEQLPQIDTVIMAVGGGGLISGVGTYLKAKNPLIRIIGVEPENCPTLYNSFKSGQVVSVADIQTRVGTLAIRRTSDLNFQLARACVDEIVLVSDQQMLDASQVLWREYGIAGELSGVASFAGLLSGLIKLSPGEKVCALICGVGTEGIKQSLTSF